MRQATLINTLATCLKQHKMKMVTAESCTGGMLAAKLTDIAGSSAWFERGFVTYSNEAKKQCLSVNASTIDTYGAVSIEVAGEMALGALKNSEAEVAIAITGIAGPSGGSRDKPVGTVCFGLAFKNHTSLTWRCHFDGDRRKIRQLACIMAIKKLVNWFDSLNR
jgi:nicotinamide-nucleotide amidase